MFGIGLAELLIVLIAGLLLVCVPTAIIVLLVLLLRKEPRRRSFRMVRRALLAAFLFLGASGFACAGWVGVREDKWPFAAVVFGFSALCLAAAICAMLFEVGKDYWRTYPAVHPGSYWILSEKEQPMCCSRFRGFRWWSDVILLTRDEVRARKRTGLFEKDIYQRLHEAHGNMEAVLHDKWTKVIPLHSIHRLELDSMNMSTVICYLDRSLRHHRWRTVFNEGMFRALGAAFNAGCQPLACDMRAIDAVKQPARWLVMTLFIGWHLPPMWLGLTAVFCGLVIIWGIQRLVRRPRIQVFMAPGLRENGQYTGCREIPVMPTLLRDPDTRRVSPTPRLSLWISRNQDSGQAN